MSDSPPRLPIDELYQHLSTYLTPKEVEEVYRAYLLSAEAHKEQKRSSGEPYITHPIAVALILVKMQMDAQTLCAALLHDVLEDTTVTKQELSELFSTEVAELVDGVSKLNHIEFETRELAQAASFQKMLLAMSRDIRVIIVKLADRLHNMRTLHFVKPEKRRRIARETLDIYAPIANRLGMNKIRIQLEELSFSALYPLRHKILAHHTTKLCNNSKRIEHFSMIQTTLEHRLRQYHIDAKVQKRDIHLYSVYYKMRARKKLVQGDKSKSFVQVTKLYPFQIIVDSVDTCYRVLGIVHNLYKPLRDGFQDHIAIPKVNGYQSLHSTVFSPYGVPIEVQIRTVIMHHLAEYGITAQTNYPNHELCSLGDQAATRTYNYVNELKSPRQRAYEWLNSLLEAQRDSGDSLELLDQVKRDLFPNEVYVFTPKGKILQLPSGATIIDFAYAIHSDIGNNSVAAKVDNQYAPLSAQLASGQTVEVITANWGHPSSSWLDFAVTARARNHIRNYLKNLKQDAAVILGKQLLDKELSQYSLSTDRLIEDQRIRLLNTFNVSRLELLLADIGLGNRMALVVVHQLLAISTSQESFRHSQSNPLIIKGTEGAVVTFPRCCRAIPGDEIIGFISSGRGITVHTVHCKNIAEYHHQPDKWLAVQWESDIKGEFLTDIRVEVKNQPGALATVAAALTKMGSNIESVATENRDDIFSILRFCIHVKHRTHLADIMRHLRRLDMVIRIARGK